MDAWAGAAHELGVDEEFRGLLDLGLDLEAWRGDGWGVELGTAVHTLVRENRANESVVRISPRAVAYSAVARISLGDRGWALFALHRSQHDVDSDDAVGNRETISYEIYGAQWTALSEGGGRIRVAGGVYYDRGTTLDGVAQTRPFDHYLGGVRGDGLLPLRGLGAGPGYLAATVELVGHRDPAHLPLAYLNTGGAIEGGIRLEGPAGELRVGLGLVRVEDPLHLGQAARHLLLLSVRAGSGLLLL